MEKSAAYYKRGEKNRGQPRSTVVFWRTPRCFHGIPCWLGKKRDWPRFFAKIFFVDCNQPVALLNKTIIFLECLIRESILNDNKSCRLSMMTYTYLCEEKGIVIQFFVLAVNNSVNSVSMLDQELILEETLITINKRFISNKWWKLKKIFSKT